MSAGTARIGPNATDGAVVADAPTSHVDVVPTLLAAAGIDEGLAACGFNR